MAQVMNTSNQATLGLFGSGGYGSEVFSMIKAGQSESPEINISSLLPSQVLLISEHTDGVNRRSHLSEEDFYRNPSDKFFGATVSDYEIRRRIVSKAIQNGCSPVSIRDVTSRVDQDSRIGVGHILSAFSLISPNVEIGDFFQLNIYAYVAHNVKIGNYVTLGPRSSCNGNVMIEDDVYVGSGALIINGNQKKPIVLGKGSVVGMGAVVTKDVEPFTTVVGNPAKPINRKS